jgi:hypothetical protein
VSDATFAESTAAVVLLLNGLATVVGGWLWWRVEPRRIGWALLRAGQVAAAGQAVAAGVLALRGFDPDGLYWLYALLPVAVGFFAEQLRLASAQTVLDSRGLEDAQAVGRLDEAAQRSVVLAIVRREMGVLVVAAGVTVFLAARVFPLVGDEASAAAPRPFTVPAVAQWSGGEGVWRARRDVRIVVGRGASRAEARVLARDLGAALGGGHGRWSGAGCGPATSSCARAPATGARGTSFGSRAP